MHKYAIAFGTFDGLHLGHMAVLNRVREGGFTPLALTFDVPPKMPDKKALILKPETKCKQIEKLGITPVVMDFNEIKDISPLEFLNRVYEKYSPALISTGFNYRFGKDAAGNTDTLENFCKEKGIEYIMSAPIKVGENIVSSTNIRKFIAEGDMTSATAQLGRSFFFEGEIVHGDKRGRTIGFPTINQVYPTGLVCPKYGVYSGYTEIEGNSYRSVTNVGMRPTFKTEYVTAETYLFDFCGDVYGKNARVHLCDFIRSETKFSSLEELEKALKKDKEAAILKNSGKDDL